MRFLLLLAACVCAFVVMVNGFGWDWFGLESVDVRQQIWGWLGASLLFAELSRLPVPDWMRKYGG